MKENMNFLVILLGLCLHQAAGVTHSLKYFYTASSEVPSFPEFVVVAMVDDVQFVHYDSNSKQAVPKLDWVNKAADPQYWERETGHFLGSQQVMKVDIETLKGRFNQTGGVHVFQNMYGCQWDDANEAVEGHDQYGYDGEDLISLDLKDLRYISAKPEALITKQSWDRNRGQLEYLKNYYTQECVNWLKKYLKYGSNTLEREVPPKVSLFQKDSSELVCHATGFYPDVVMFTWKKDGQELEDDVNVSETLPNEDGTFQKRSMLTVSPTEWKEYKFTCEVAYKGGSTFRNMDQDEQQPGGSVPIGLIVGIAISVFLLIGSIVGVLWWRQRNSGFVRANTKDDGSTSSDETQRKV